jgi:hypothetical protein
MPSSTNQCPPLTLLDRQVELFHIGAWTEQAVIFDVGESDRPPLESQVDSTRRVTPARSPNSQESELFLHQLQPNQANENLIDSPNSNISNQILRNDLTQFVEYIDHQFCTCERNVDSFRAPEDSYAINQISGHATCHTTQQVYLSIPQFQYSHTEGLLPSRPNLPNSPTSHQRIYTSRSDEISLAHTSYDITPTNDHLAESIDTSNDHTSVPPAHDEQS